MRLATLRLLPRSRLLSRPAQHLRPRPDPDQHGRLLRPFWKRPLRQRPRRPTKEPKRPSSFDLNSLDKTADPCTDFYQYSCGNWVKNNPIPSDQVRWGRFNELAERNNYLLYQELKSASEAPKTPSRRSTATTSRPA